MGGNQVNCVITNGTCYIKRDDANVLIAVDSLDEATLFPLEKAQGTLKCLPKALKDKGFMAKKVSDVLQEADVILEDDLEELSLSTSNYVPDMEESPKLRELKQNLLLVDQILGTVQGTYTDVCEELNNVNKEIIDIEHAIEFMKPNAARAYYLESELKKARIKRRECKDIKTLLEIVLTFEKNDWGSGKLQKAFKRSEKRSYKPRVRRDLFE